MIGSRGAGPEGSRIREMLGVSFEMVYRGPKFERVYSGGSRTGGTFLEPVLDHHVEHVLGPGRRVFSNAIPCERVPASTPAAAENSECNAPPARLSYHQSLFPVLPLRLCVFA